MSVKSLSASELQGRDTVNDPRLGVNEHGVKCPSCHGDYETCPNHMSYVQLARPVINPVLMKTLLMVLTCVCNHCSALLVSKDTLMRNGLLSVAGGRRFKRIHGLCMKGFRCTKNSFQCKVNPHFNTEKSVESNLVTYEKPKDKRRGDTGGGKDMTEFMTYHMDTVQMILNGISKEDAMLMGFDETCHPSSMVFTVLPIPPPSARMSTHHDGKVWQDRLTLNYMAIIRLNRMLSDPENNETMQRKLYSDLVLKLKETLIKDPKSIFSQLSKKDGHVRGMLMGKRADYSGRSVISPDPSLAFGDIRLPPLMAHTITQAIRITDQNREVMKAKMRAGRVPRITPVDKHMAKNEYQLVDEQMAATYEPRVGDVFHRWTETGDYVVSNRAADAVHVQPDGLPRRGA